MATETTIPLFISIESLVGLDERMLQAVRDSAARMGIVIASESDPNAYWRQELAHDWRCKQ